MRRLLTGCAQAACQKNTTQAIRSSCQMPSTARQLRQPPTIEAIGRVPYFANVETIIAIYYLYYFSIYSYLLLPLRLSRSHRLREN